MLRKLMSIGLAALVALPAGTLLAGPANAVDKTEVCPSWTTRSIAQGGTEWNSEPADKAGVRPNGSVRLYKPEPLGGTEFATSDLGLSGEGRDLVVRYKLSEDAKFSAGAVRLFYYDTTGADTLTTAPTQKAVADATSGKLVIPNITGSIGTVGLVYDGSNDGEGYVKFANLRLNGKGADNDVRIRFDGGCPEPEPEFVASQLTADAECRVNGTSRQRWTLARTDQSHPTRKVNAIAWVYYPNSRYDKANGSDDPNDGWTYLGNVSVPEGQPSRTIETPYGGGLAVHYWDGQANKHKLWTTSNAGTVCS